MTKESYFVGSKFEEEYGFSKAIKHGNTIHVSGSSGYNYDTETVAEDASEQLTQAFQNIESALTHFAVKADLPLPEFKVEITAIAAARD